MKTYANKGAAASAAKAAGIVGARFLQGDDNRWSFENPAPAPEVEPEQEVAPVIVEQEQEVAPIDPVAEARAALDKLSDDDFAKAILAGKGRQSRKSPKAGAKNAKTNPGMYVGERRGYPQREGLCKSYWDFLTTEWENAGKELDFSITAEDIRAICEAYGWNVSSFAAEYRYWRLHFGINVKTRATAPARVQVQNANAGTAPAPASKEDALIEEVTPQDDVHITEV